jgi:hypothetical protein
VPAWNSKLEIMFHTKESIGFRLLIYFCFVSSF